MKEKNGSVFDGNAQNPTGFPGKVRLARFCAGTFS